MCNFLAADSKEAVGAPDAEIEVTPAMIKAGLSAYYGGDRVEEADNAGKVEIFTSIFRAMALAARTTKHRRPL
jgi:hypothetical protein